MLSRIVRLTLASALLLISSLATLGQDQARTDVQGNAPGKLLKVLVIGNSYSQNATQYLPDLVKSQGNRLIIASAEIGGCSLEKHWSLAEKHESNPGDPEGKPYGPIPKSSLKEKLQANQWDIVTLQQHSWLSRDLKTYQPFAGKLADYVRRYAPGAKIVLQETWAYRADDATMLKKNGITQEQMYVAIHEAYKAIAKELSVDTIIPTGTAFQNAWQDPRWQLQVPASIDPTAFKYPQLPPQRNTLIIGWQWSKLEPRKLMFDPKHCVAAGKYLGALCWYETLFGDLTNKPYVPAELSAIDAALMQEIAHKTVKLGLKPKLPADMR